MGTERIHMYITFLIYFIFVHLSLFIPGYALVSKTGLLSANKGLELSFSYVASIAVLGLLATLGYSAGIDWGFLRLVGWLLILLGGMYFIRQRLWTEVWLQRLPLFCVVMLSAMSLLFISLEYNKDPQFVPDPQRVESSDYTDFSVKVLNISQTAANDNSVPYRQAQFFINRSNPAKDSFIDEWGVHFFQRTPLMGAVTASYFNLFNDHPPVDYIWKKASIDPDYTFIKFQILGIILNSIFIIPAFFLLAKLFDRRIAILSSLFFVISPFFIYNSFFSWPKSLVAFFVLLMWGLLIENRLRYAVLAGVVAGLAYLSHDLAVLYIGASALYLIVSRRWRDLLIMSGISAAFASPWLYVSAIMFKKPSTFIYYPLSTNGIPQVSQRAQVVRAFLSTSPIEILMVRVNNLFYLLSPYQLLTSEGNQEVGRRLWALSLFSTTGALGVGLLIPVYLAIFKVIRKTSYWIFVLTPVVLSVIIIGWPKGLGALHFAQPVVVLFTGLAIAFLASLKNTVWTMLAYIANVVQLAFFLLYSYGFGAQIWLRSLESSVAILVLITIAAVCGMLTYSITTRKSNLLVEVIGQ